MYAIIIRFDRPLDHTNFFSFVGEKISNRPPFFNSFQYKNA